MSSLLLPTKLKKEPLVDALFDIRFSSPVSAASSILLGLLFAKFSSATTPTRIERLPISDIPSQMRNADPILKFQPLLKLYTDRFLIMLGDTNVTVACQLPYAGWSLFKSKILEIVGILKDTKIIHEIERYSMKYVDIVEGKDTAEQIDRAVLDLTIGQHKLVSEPFSVRLEIKRDYFTNIVQIATPSTALLATGETRTGILIDVDTIIDLRTSDLATFLEELPNRLEFIHMQNKTIFFECLKPETIEYLEPTYDPVSI